MLPSDEVYDDFWIDEKGNQYNLKVHDDWIDIYRKDDGEFIWVFRWPREILDGYDDGKNRQ